jgi:uncharacterized Fe-S cluster-containing MiaB family protein
MDNCPEASVEIKKEIRNFLKTKKIRAMEQYLDMEDEAQAKKVLGRLHPVLAHTTR